MSEINQKIAELKKQMYDLEIEAETFQIKFRIVPMYSFYTSFGKKNQLSLAVDMNFRKHEVFKTKLL